MLLYKRSTNLKSVNFSGTHEALRVYAKSIYRTLRRLKKYSVVAVDIMKVILNLKSVDVVSGMVT